MAKEIFPSPDYATTSKESLQMKHFGQFPYLTLAQSSEASAWEDLTQKLTGLPFREFWSKHRGNSFPAHHRSLTVPDPVYSAELKERVSRLLDISESRYGRLKNIAQKEVAQKYSERHPDPDMKRSPEDGSIPFWGS
jgi:hypothetical protein